VRQLIRTVLSGLWHDVASLRTTVAGRRSEARRQPVDDDGHLAAFDRSMPKRTATYGPAGDERGRDRGE
jgi:hypothetical protein